METWALAVAAGLAVSYPRSWAALLQRPAVAGISILFAFAGLMLWAGNSTQPLMGVGLLIVAVVICGGVGSAVARGIVVSRRLDAQGLLVLLLTCAPIAVLIAVSVARLGILPAAQVPAVRWGALVALVWSAPVACSLIATRSRAQELWHRHSGTLALSGLALTLISMALPGWGARAVLVVGVLAQVLSLVEVVRYASRGRLPRSLSTLLMITALSLVVLGLGVAALMVVLNGAVMGTLLSLSGALILLWAVASVTVAWLVGQCWTSTQMPDPLKMDLHGEGCCCPQPGVTQPTA